MSFPLLERKIIGYQFSQPTSYSSFHLGTDYKAFYVDLYAPCDGFVTMSIGKQGGKTITFKPDHQDVVIRFLHLDEFIKAGRILKGERIAVTGNTGTSTNPHVHIDISKHTLNLNDISNFIDPEQFNWEQTPMKLTVQVIFNNQKWISETSQLKHVQQQMLLRSGGRVVLEFLPSIYTTLTNFPFLVYIAGGIGVSAIKQQWYQDYISPLSKADVTIFVANKTDYIASFDNRRTQGYCYFHLGGKFPIEIQMLCEENDKSVWYNGLDAFADYAIHEICHGLYALGDVSNNDRTHFHYEFGPDGINKAFDDFDYQLIERKKNMTNALIAKHGSTYGVFLPATSPDGLITLLKNIGFEPPLKDGKLDFAVLDTMVKNLN